MLYWYINNGFAPAVAGVYVYPLTQFRFDYEFHSHFARLKP
jgi:hypothetical protein